jgi:glycerol-3-phosphate dehydrogenase (NAD(P)+)
MAATRESHRLPGHRMPDPVTVTAAMPEAADLVLLAVPMQHMRRVVPLLPPVATVVCAKGVETGTLCLPLEVLAELRPECPGAVLTGPNFAAEVAAGLPAAAVIAGPDPDLRDRVAATIGTPTFRLYGNDDPLGAQLGGAAKNVIAIAAGAVMGAGLGENARAALITRGLAEVSRLVVALGGRAETTMGLSGLGDLLLTCTGPSSRNFSLGFGLGQGQALTTVLAARTAVTEGIATAPALIGRTERDRVGVDLPICRAVTDLLSERLTLPEVMAGLLNRPRRDEHEARPTLARSDRP